MTRPQISVIIPSFCSPSDPEPAFLRAALESVARQRFRDFEVLVIEDGEDAAPSNAAIPRMVEAARKVAPDLSWRYLQTDRKFGTPAGPRNLGIRQAQGDWIAFLDHDDTWQPQKLQQQMDLATQKPEVVMIHGNVRFIFENAVKPPRLLSEMFRPCRGNASMEEFLKSYTVMSAVVVRKSLLEQIGFLDESMSPCDDMDLFLKLAEGKSAIGFVPEVCATYRVHGNNLSKDKRRVNEQKLRVLEGALTRLGENPERTYVEQTRHRLAKALDRSFINWIQRHLGKLLASFSTE